MKRKLYILTTLILVSIASYAANGDVTLTRSGANQRACTISNDLVSVYINTSGEITSFLLYKDSDGNFGNSVQLTTDKGYFSVANSNGAVSLSISSFYVKVQTSDMVEVQYVTPTIDGFEWVIGYIVRRGVAGVYHYVQANCKSDNSNFSELRMGFRGNPSLFNYAYVDDDVQEALPTPSEIVNATTVTDATYKIDDERPIYTKYNYAAFQKDDTVHGMMGDQVGVWMITPSTEWLNGGPMRQDLTVHATETTPIILRHFHGNHFGGVSGVMSKGQSKYYGPHLIYVNQSTNSDVTLAHNEMIANAKAQAVTEQEQWPYTWLRDNNIKKRGSVTGKIAMSSSDASYFATTEYQVILAQPGKKPMLQGDGYQFWAETDSEGNFTINNVRAGSYTLYAYALNGAATGYYELDGITITNGNTTELGTMMWTPDEDRYDEVLWQIGEADHLSAGFNMSGAKRQYGRTNDIPTNLTYTIGTSEEALDWYYAQAHNGTWTIKYNLNELPVYPLRLTIATAGAANAKLTVRSNETTSSSGIGVFRPLHDGSVSRCATLAGRDSIFVADIPVSQLKVGENSLYLNLWGLGTDNLDNSLGGLMYDMIKLEKKNTTIQVISEETVMDFSGETVDNSSGLTAITNYNNTGFYLRGATSLAIPIRVPGKDTRTFNFSDGSTFSGQNFATLSSQTKNDYSELPAANGDVVDKSRLNIGFQTTVPGTVYIAFQAHSSPASESKLRLALNGTIVKEASLTEAAAKSARLDIMEYKATEPGTFFIDSYGSNSNVFYVKFVPNEDPVAPIASTSHWNFRQYYTNDYVLQGTSSSAMLDYSGLYLHVANGHSIQAKTSTLTEAKEIGGVTYSKATTPSILLSVGAGTVKGGYPASSAKHTDVVGIDVTAAGTWYVMVQPRSSSKTFTFNFNGTDYATTYTRDAGVIDILSYHTDDAGPLFLKSTGEYYLIASAFVPDEEETTSQQTSISAAGYATFCSPYNLTLPEGLKAFVVTNVTSSSVTLETISVIPSCTGVVLKGEEGNYVLTTTSSATAVTTNSMMANLGEYTLAKTNDSYYNYTLASGPTFKPSSGSGKLAAGKSFLRTTVAPPEGAKPLELIFIEETDGIREASNKNSTTSDAIYTLSGQRISSPVHGIYIIKGKKVFVK